MLASSWPCRAACAAFTFQTVTSLSMCHHPWQHQQQQQQMFVRMQLGWPLTSLGGGDNNPLSNESRQ